MLVGGTLAGLDLEDPSLSALSVADLEKGFRDIPCRWRAASGVRTRKSSLLLSSNSSQVSGLGEGYSHCFNIGRPNLSTDGRGLTDILPATSYTGPLRLRKGLITTHVGVRGSGPVYVALEPTIAVGGTTCYHELLIIIIDFIQVYVDRSVLVLLTTTAHLTTLRGGVECTVIDRASHDEDLVI